MSFADRLLEGIREECCKMRLDSVPNARGGSRQFKKYPRVKLFKFKKYKIQKASKLGTSLKKH